MKITEEVEAGMMIGASLNQAGMMREFSAN